MEIWQYIEILNRPGGHSFSIEEKYEALAQIYEAGDAYAIPGLVPALKDKNEAVRDATCKTIIYLFSKSVIKKNHYDVLKHCDISLSDIDFFEKIFPKEHFINLMAIASLNCNGHVRERSVNLLSVSNNSQAIQFLIYRMADWVPQVRQAAINGIEYFKRPAFLEALIENLPLLEWLQKVERTDLKEIYNSVISYIAKENKDFVLANFNRYPDKLRLLLARHLSTETTLLLRDKYSPVRNITLQHFDLLSPAEINKLLKDKSAQIRLQTLYRLKGTTDFIDIVSDFLADASGSVRLFARYSFKGTDLSFLDIYLQNLSDNKQVAGSLMGLAEIDAKTGIEAVERYLQHERPKIRKIAFLVLAQLDKDRAYNFALQQLDCGITSVRNVIIDFISRHANDEVLEKARGYLQNARHEVRLSMLALFSKVGGWPVIGDLMLGTIDNNDIVRQISSEYVHIWHKKATELYFAPKEADIQRARRIFNFAYEMHEDKKFFVENPLAGLGFFLR